MQTELHCHCKPQMWQSNTLHWIASLPFAITTHKNRHCEPQAQQSNTPRRIASQPFTMTTRKNRHCEPKARQSKSSIQGGFSLIELIVFMVVVGLAFSSMVLVYNQSVINSVDPTIRVQLAELAQSQLDEILARKYDENTPTGGIPACGSQETGAPTCAGPGLESGENINNESTLDDVDDFDGFSDTPYPGYTRTVSVSQTGNAKQVTVTVSGPNNQQLALSAFRANF